jgi:hypothetical protein
MTDARQSLPDDRRPERDTAEAQRPQQAVSAARKVWPPRNPWLVTLLAAWILLLTTAVIAQLASASTQGGAWDGNGTDPVVLGRSYEAVAAWTFSAAVGVFALWIAVKAVIWKPPS